MQIAVDMQIENKSKSQTSKPGTPKLGKKKTAALIIEKEEEENERGRRERRKR